MSTRRLPLALRRHERDKRKYRFRLAPLSTTVPTLPLSTTLQSLDLSNCFQWLRQQKTVVPDVLELRSLTLPAFNLTCAVPVSVPCTWFSRLHTFTLVVQLEENDDGEETQSLQSMLPESVTTFALHFAHCFNDYACAVRSFVQTKDPPFRVASVGGEDLSALFVRPDMVTTLEFGLVGPRKVLLDVLGMFSVHFNGGRHTASLFVFCGLSHGEWAPRFSGVETLRLHRMVASEATEFAVCMDQALFPDDDSDDGDDAATTMRDFTIEMYGTECDAMRSPRYSNTLVHRQMMLRRRGYRMVIVEDEQRRQLRSMYDRNKIMHAGRYETATQRALREQQERERRRCDDEALTDYGTLDGECSPLEGQARAYRRWAPQVYRRSRDSLRTQKFGAEERELIQLYCKTWTHWAHVARAVALGQSVPAKFLPPLKAPVSVRRIGVQGQSRIVAVWDRDQVLNTMAKGHFSNDIIASFEYLCGLNMQIDPLNVVCVEDAPVVPNYKEIALRKALLPTRGCEARLNRETAEWYDKKHIVTLNGLCMLGLRMQRPCLSVGMTRPRGERSALASTYATLLRFVENTDTERK